MKLFSSGLEALPYHHGILAQPQQLVSNQQLRILPTAGMNQL
jgi:hypothetical protein